MTPPLLPMYCMIARATVDLPQPELADDADASPGITVRSKSTTAGISPARVK